MIQQFNFFFQVSSTSRSSPKTNTLSMILNIIEGAPPGSIIGSLRPHDKPDTAVLEGQVTYLVVGGTDRDGTFMVDRLKGDVYLVRELDYEKGSRYTLHVEVSDFSQEFPSSHLVQLDIHVQDSNDHAPQFMEDPVTIVIPENIEPGASIYTFQALDKVGNLWFKSCFDNLLTAKYIILDVLRSYRTAVDPTARSVTPSNTTGLTRPTCSSWTVPPES